MVTYNETETSQDTENSYGFRRNSSTTTLDNQLDFTSAVPSYSNYSSYQTPTIEKEEEEQMAPSYEVEREYNIDKLPEDEIIIPTFMPTVRSAEPAPVMVHDYKIKLNARGKIIASVFGVIACLLVAFMIYNAVLISKLSNNLKALEVEQATRSATITELESDYQDLTSYKQMEMNAGDLGFTYSENGKDVVVNLTPRPEIKSAKKSTNWFNNVCEFFAELFN